MAMRTAVIGLGVAVLLTACGSPAALSNLRCDGSCQSVPDPFLLQLMLDYDDPDGVLAAGTLVLSVDGNEVATYRLDSLLPAGKLAGSIAFPLALRLDAMQNGRQFIVAVHAIDGAATQTEQLELPLILQL